MAQRADWDNDDDDFEILNGISPTSYSEKFEFIEDDSFEIIPSKNKPLPLVNTHPIAHVPIIEKPVPVLINISKLTVSEVKQSSETSSHLPIRYGSAALIPHNENSDLKSLLTRQPYLPHHHHQRNDLLDLLQMPKTPLLIENNLHELLINNDHNRQNLIQLAKQARQDFLHAIQLD